MGPSLEIVRNEAVSASLIEFSVHGLDPFETTGDAEELHTQTNVGIRICAWRRTFIDTMHAKNTGLRWSEAEVLEIFEVLCLQAYGWLTEIGLGYVVGFPYFVLFEEFMDKLFRKTVSPFPNYEDARGIRGFELHYLLGRYGVLMVLDVDGLNLVVTKPVKGEGLTLLTLSEVKGVLPSHKVNNDGVRSETMVDISWLPGVVYLSSWDIHLGDVIQDWF
jgi:hypothetical protein